MNWALYKKQLSVLVVLLGVFLFWGCERNTITVEKGPLYFDTDTVAFDSIFRTLQTPSERLLVYNRSKYNMRVSEIALESGDNSEFDLIVNGIRGNKVEDLVIENEDSILIFITLKSELKDNFKEEYITFKVGDETQRVLIRAFVIDAYIFRAEAVYDNSNQFLGWVNTPAITQDTSFTPNKAIVIDGPLFVPANTTLSIQAGTQLYFTSRQQSFGGYYTFTSMIYVEGSLKVQGTSAFPVVMQGTRKQKDDYYNYYEASSQWRGLWFAWQSQNSEVEHALIKNGTIGIFVDSIARSGQPKVSVKKSIIRNMSAYGVFGNYGRGSNIGIGSAPMIVMENCLVNDCKGGSLALSNGGNYEFYNCTFGGDSINRNDPLVAVVNYYEDENKNTYPADMRAQFVNSIIYGRENNEIVLGNNIGALFDVKLDHCLVKYDSEKNDKIPNYCTNTIFNENPKFVNSVRRNFRLQAGSPCIDAGADLSFRFMEDIRGRADSVHKVPFDLGCYEFYAQ